MYKSNFSFKVDEKDNLLIISMSGDMDKLALQGNKHKINEFINNFKGETVAFDMDSLTYINSESIGYIFEINNYLKSVSKRVVLVGVKGNIKDILNAIGIAEVIDIFDSLNSFINQE
jgi:anti-anti-sigma factor